MTSFVEDAIVETKNQHLCCVRCKGLARRLWLATLAGHCNLWHCAGRWIWFCNGSRGLVPPAANMGGRVTFGVWQANGLGLGSSRSHGTGWMAFNRDDTFLAEMSGDRPDWPVFDHFGRYS